MDRNRDLRRTAISTVNGLPRRRQRVTTLRDSTDGDRRMELKETVRLRDREQLQKKDRDRDFPKRRRVDNKENESTDSSDEEYFEEEEETRIHQQNRTNQLSPASSSLSNNRRGLRSLRSSPMLRAAVDELLGVPIPRRSRSASAKKLHEYRNSGSGGFGEDLTHQKFLPSPATVSPIVSGGASPSSSGASMKKKMKYVEPRTWVLSSASNSKPSSMTQDDIEIEVAEALFDLMKQSHSQSQSSEREEKVVRDSTNNDDDDDFKRLKAERGKDENDAFKVQIEQSIEVNTETILADSMKELNKGGRIDKEKFPDDPAHELVSGDGFVDKGKVGSPKESESPPCVKVNACDIQDPTVKKADYAASVVEAKEARIEIDLMALPSLPSSPERDDAVLDIGPKVRTQDNVQKKSKTTPKDGIRMPEEKIGVISGNQLLNLNLEKHRHDISSVGDSTTQQQQGRKEPKNQSPTSLLSSPIGMGSWPGVLPHPGYMPSHRAVLPIDGSARSSMTMQHRRKRCATHQYIAGNIQNHQQLIEKSLSSGPTGAATLYGAKPLNFKSMLPTQRFIPGPGNSLLGDFEGGRNLATIPGGRGKDSSDFINATTSGKTALQRAASNQAPAHNFWHNPGFTFALGRHQTTTMTPANSPQSASAISNLSSLSNNSSRKLSAKKPSLPEASSTAVSFNHPIFPSNEAAASYMAILQNSGCPFPIPTNIISLPSFKGGSSSSMPFLNSSFYSPPVFNISQNQHMLSLDNKLPAPEKNGASVGGGSVKPNHNNAPTYSFPVGNNNNNKHSDISQQGSKNRAELVPQPAFPLSFGSNASSPTNFSSMAQNSSIFQMLPEMPWNGSKNLPTSEEKSQTRGGHASSSLAPSKFDSSAQTLNFLPSSLNSIVIPNFYHHQHQMQQLKASDYSSFLPKWDNFSRTAAPEGSSHQSLVHIPQLKNSQAQNHITFGNNPALIGSLSSSSISRNTSIVGSASTVSVLASQETEGSQKSSPACRRNVPLILSTCAGQLPELKY